MTKAPWFKFFSGDYLSSPFVQGLDPELELWYVRLIIASAIGEPRGCLPLDAAKLWRLAKAPSLARFEERSAEILAKFEKDEVAGVYRVSKVANQLIANGDVSIKRSEAGKKGARARWQMPSTLPSKSLACATSAKSQEMAESESESEKESDSDTENHQNQAPGDNQRPQSDRDTVRAGNLKRPRAFGRPTFEDIAAYCRERGNTVDPQQWFDYYSANGWKVGRSEMRDWRAAVRTWERNGFRNGQTRSSKGQQQFERIKQARDEAHALIDAMDNRPSGGAGISTRG